jgi:hypothetical protein
LFWSCADVSIVNDYRETCSGHGVVKEDGSCQCHVSYSGDVCQYKDECASDADCSGETKGLCQFVTPYSYPKFQCYCQPGWFGLKCDKESAFKSVQYNTDDYQSKDLSSNLKLFYRILMKSDELEVVLVGQTSSFIGLGWKSPDSKCMATGGGVKPDGTAVPKGNPVTEGTSSKPGGNPVPTSKPSGNLAPESTPVPEGNPVPEGSAVPAGSSNPGASPEPGGSPSDLTGMDCTDMVIGAAINKLHRVRDYFSQDRSTPRLDEFYNGMQSLTAAIAEEANGSTTIMFRKPIKVSEFVDNEIKDEYMIVIWSHGQPVSAQTPALRDFYRQDELKYHANNRGKTSLNFHIAVPKIGAMEDNFKVPAECVGDACAYFVSWSLDPATDVIMFTIKAKQMPDKWTGIGIGVQQKMENMDVYYGFMNNNSQGIIVDAWVSDWRTAPVADAKQSIRSSQISAINGITTLIFSRPRNTGDPQDWAFSDKDCYYFMYPMGGGDVINTSIMKHIHPPIISTEKICIKAPPSGSGTIVPVNDGNICALSAINISFAIIITLFFS